MAKIVGILVCIPLAVGWVVLVQCVANGSAGALWAVLVLGGALIGLAAESILDLLS